MIYLDTSCLLKLLLEERGSAAVRAAVGIESIVIVSILTELETEVQLKAAHLGGELSLSQWRQMRVRLSAMRNLDPFHFRSLSGTVFQCAMRQFRNSGEIHCRTADRLHLAAMEELKLSRLMTHDESQAAAALDVGFKVVRP